MVDGNTRIRYEQGADISPHASAAQSCERAISSKQQGLMLVIVAVAALLLAFATLMPAKAYADGPYDGRNEFGNRYIAERFAQPAYTYLEATPTGSLELIQMNWDTYNLDIQTYSPEYELLNTKVIPGSEIAPQGADLERYYFLGLYTSPQYHYVLTGQDNSSEDDSREVMKLNKYSKSWQKLAEYGFRGINTINPYSGGKGSMMEYDGKLYIHLSHEMYTSSDGLNHQASMKFIFDVSSPSTLTLLDDMYTVYNVAGASLGYVSHTFNQALQQLNGSIFSLDQGDAYPRGFVIKKMGSTGAIPIRP